MRADLKRLKREAESGRSAAGMGTRQAPRRISHAYIAMAAVIAISSLVVIGFLALRDPLPPPRVLSATQITNDNLPKSWLVTDGPRLYFQETVNEREIVSQVSAGGGDISHILTPFPNTSVMDVSPARSELLVGSSSGEENFISGSETPQWTMSRRWLLILRLFGISSHFSTYHVVNFDQSSRPLSLHSNKSQLSKLFSG
jgi:hypothetical protein